MIEAAVNSLDEVVIGDGLSPLDFVKLIFGISDVSTMLIYLSRLPVFETEFALALSHDLELLALTKKLKYFTNLPVSQNLLLLQQVVQRFGKDTTSYNKAFLNLMRTDCDLSSAKLKDFIKEKKIMLINSNEYLENNVALETIDPHAVYPTSIYRHSNGLTLATADSQTIEAVMSTTLTTTIKITRGVLDPSNMILANFYQPLGRCVAIVDDKVVLHYGEKLQSYFDYHGIKLVMLVHGGNEIDKDIQHVEEILVELKKNNVARNEPVLIMGGGVIADIGGFATALYHRYTSISLPNEIFLNIYFFRNTPYVMLCTSIVTGIDAGPSPRTCCDGFGFKNLYGAYHPPVLTLTDRAFWKTLHEGWIRHGIAEIIKMSVVEDKSLFELLEKAGPRLIETKFGTEGDTDEEFEELCDSIIGKAMEGYVRSEYGNLWETHQCRPHAYGHNWSPGYELPAGMLHGHAVATCMGYGAYLAKVEKFITEEECQRIMNLISNMELSLWHDIMDNHDLFEASNVKVQAKRGGNLCAPLPKSLGKCGYLNELTRETIDETLDAYKALCKSYERQGKGVQVHCHEVGLQDPSATAQDAFKDLKTDDKEKEANPKSYNDWINSVQTKRNNDWEFNVQFKQPKDTENPPDFNKFTLFHRGVENYAMNNTTLASENLQNVARMTEEEHMFSPCMVGTLESQFLKMMCQIKGAKKCLDIGTFTGMSAIAMAEGIPKEGQVITLEMDQKIASVAQAGFDASSVGEKIKVIVGTASDEMKKLAEVGETFDIIFIDAEKEGYIKYYDLAMGGLLKDDGIMLVDNSLCALLYDKNDIRSQRLHEFNQYVKNDKRVEQVVLTMREGVTIVRKATGRHGLAGCPIF